MGSGNVKLKDHNFLLAFDHLGNLKTIPESRRTLRLPLPPTYFQCINIIINVMIVNVDKFFIGGDNLYCYQSQSEKQTDLQIAINVKNLSFEVMKKFSQASKRRKILKFKLKTSSYII